MDTSVALVGRQPGRLRLACMLCGPVTRALRDRDLMLAALALGRLSRAVVPARKARLLPQRPIVGEPNRFVVGGQHLGDDFLDAELGGDPLSERNALAGSHDGGGGSRNATTCVMQVDFL